MPNPHRFLSAYAGGVVDPATVLAFHRTTFGSTRMEEGADGEKPDAAEDEGDKGPAGDDPKDGAADEGGADFKDRFEAQQKVNRDLETKLNGLRNGLKSALGIEDKKVTPEAVAVQVADLHRQLAVERVARRHNITDDADLEFLMSAKDTDAAEALAKRLAKPAVKDGDEAEDDGAGKGKTPKADKSQGAKAGSGSKATSVAQVMADRRAAREAKQ